MYSFGFVVLHYKTYNETRAAIDSILSLPRDGRDVSVVVVDNASGNGSLEKLREVYKDTSEVSFIENRKNLGFSRGNNVGFMELKKRGYNFIILSNNDIIILSRDFYLRVEEDYEKYGFAVLGPGILNPEGGRTGCGTMPPTVKFAKERIFRLYYKYYLKHLYGAYRSLTVKNYNHGTVYGDNVYCTWRNVILHGCFMIFSEEYIIKFNGLKPLTFMYAEEELLFIRLMAQGLISIYDPGIEIFHKEGAASSIDKKDKGLSKQSFRRHVQAQKILIKVLNKYPDVQNVWGEKL